MLPKIGPITTRKLVAYLGGIEVLFKEKTSTLTKVPGIGEGIASKINLKKILGEAEKELVQIEKNGFSWSFYLDKNYPTRLKECEDAPIVIRYNGQSLFDSKKIVSIVGTRKCTQLGLESCENLVADLAAAFPDLVIVSGFAYGIDICAHKAAFKNHLSTLAVLGTGLDRTYPAAHKKYVAKVQGKGALVTEFPLDRKPDPGNFVSRNRIIAGLADATIVIESGEKGGALITADMANSYNRDVFAFPGRSIDPYSVGCNNLIKNNKAALIASADDLIAFMRWDKKENKKSVQGELFVQLEGTEKMLMDILRTENPISLDQLSKKVKLNISEVSAHLLGLEFKGLVKALPGKNFCPCS